MTHYVDSMWGRYDVMVVLARASKLVKVNECKMYILYNMHMYMYVCVLLCYCGHGVFFHVTLTC
jgi:hypothetical protein